MGQVATGRSSRPARVYVGPHLPLHRFGQPERRPAAVRASTDGRLIYAIGDVHGRLDLLDALLDQIREDALAARPPKPPVLVFIGDYIDRGTSNRGVIDRVIELGRRGEFEVRALKGNHEQALLGFLDDASSGAAWVMHGGEQTLASYGVRPPESGSDEAWSRTRDVFAEALPADHLNFLTSLALTAVYGDYVFVHAGLRPAVDLSAQREADLLWIRQEFLSASGPFEKVVVHGHTPADEAFMGEHRIGIDTGAYATGVLTAVRLADQERRFLQHGLNRGQDVSGGAIAATLSAARTPAIGRRAAGGNLGYLVLLQSIVVLAVVAMLALRYPPPRVDWLAKARGLSTSVAFTKRAPRPTLPQVRAPAPLPAAKPPPGPPPVVARLTPPAVPDVPRGPAVVQIGAFASDTLADQGWRNLSNAVPDHLSGKTEAVELARSGGKSVYRTLIVGFASKADAVSYCVSLRSAGHECLVR
jgi:serine/threonine protein phosphatase 1